MSELPEATADLITLTVDALPFPAIRGTAQIISFKDDESVTAVVKLWDRVSAS